MTGLLGPTGLPISSGFQNKKATPPRLGEAFGQWAGRDIQHMQLPGGGVVQFDLSRLTVEDFRTMRDHYQVNASLAVLSFMQHQADWTIECEDPKIADFCEEQIRSNWTMLNRTMAQANWAGYSPAALNWENNTRERRIDLDKIKDLIPEECTVNWKKVDGWAPPDRTPPKFSVYDGINQFGSPYPIPVENSFWYPLLMESGDYYGRKLLRPAFTSWYFSILIHLFANRYYERFGEPTPVGRAPFDEEIGVGNVQQSGSTWMLNVLQDLRNRSVVVLPSDRSTDAGGASNFDYEIEYLESQMRGADFERYLTRLDEEISIGLFTPILLLRTADVGSYNLGVGHMQMYLWMLNAMNDDRKQYIDKYLLRKMTNYNFSERAPSPKIRFRKLGNANGEMLATVLQALIQNGQAKVDLRELGQMLGMTLSEVDQTTDADAEEDGDGDDAPDAAAPGPPGREDPDAPAAIGPVVTEIVARVGGQVNAAFREERFGGNLQLNMGFKRKMERAFALAGVRSPIESTSTFYTNLDGWLANAVSIDFKDPAEFLQAFTKAVEYEVQAAIR